MDPYGRTRLHALSLAHAAYGETMTVAVMYGWTAQ
jgi:hypothetical protein